MEPTPWKVPHGAHTMEVTSWNLRHRSYLVEDPPWKLPHGTFTIEVSSWNLDRGSYFVEL